MEIESMFYKKYFLFDEEVEIMLPSILTAATTPFPLQYYWTSQDEKITVYITRGGSMDATEEFDTRLNEYYKRFGRDFSRFVCNHIAKRKINGRSYGEMRYTSYMMGYPFFTIFLIGTYKARELLILIQHVGNEFEEDLYIFENVLDSVKIARNC